MIDITQAERLSFDVSKANNREVPGHTPIPEQHPGFPAVRYCRRIFCLISITGSPWTAQRSSHAVVI